MDELTFALGLRRGTLGSIDSAREEMRAVDVARVLLESGACVRFENLTITGDLDLHEQTVNREAVFLRCELGTVDAQNARFQKQFRLEQCSIRRWRASYATFEGDLQLIAGAIINLSLNNAVFQKGCSLTRIKLGRVDLSSCRAAGNLRMRRAVADSVNLTGTVIAGACDLRRLQAKELLLYGARCGRLQASHCSVTIAALDQFEVAGDLSLDFASFGDLSILNSKAGGDVDLTWCRADNVDLSGSSGTARIILTGLQVAEDLTMINSRFLALEGELTTVFGRAVIGDSKFSAVYLQGVHFASGILFERNSVSGPVSVRNHGGMKSSFGGRLSMAGSTSASQVVIEDTNVDGDLCLQAVSCESIFIERLRVSGHVDISGVTAVQTIRMDDGSTIGGNLDARAISTASVRLNDAELYGIQSIVDISYAKVRGSLSLNRVTARSVHAGHSDVAGSLEMREARIDKSLYFARSRFGEIVFDGRSEGELASFVFPRLVNMRDCHYGTLHATWPVMLRSFQRQPQYEATSYRAFEAYVRNLGRVDWADRVYLAARRHATRSLPSSLERGSQVLLDLISGYGVQPVKLLRAALIMFVLMFFTLFLYANLNKSVFGTSAASDGRDALKTVAMAVDVLTQGEKSSYLARFNTGDTRQVIRLFIDIAIALRYATLALLALWAAYITGLVRYSSSGRT